MIEAEGGHAVISQRPHVMMGRPRQPPRHQQLHGQKCIQSPFPMFVESPRLLKSQEVYADSSAGGETAVPGLDEVPKSSQ
ncbi:hypothetical protein ILYODFUR_022330 [Ilyodon furcidens]|uniref:Uncharacterized protein n=1 Tax=Ilyodon furcidens TaxID=33524 RepID=A0ABV0VGR7_9TELE